MKKHSIDRRKVIGIITISVIVIIFVFGLLIEFLSEEAKELHVFLFDGPFSIVSVSVFLVFVGVLSWLIVSQVLLRVRPKKIKRRR